MKWRARTQGAKEASGDIADSRKQYVWMMWGVSMHFDDKSQLYVGPMGKLKIAPAIRRTRQYSRETCERRKKWPKHSTGKYERTKIQQPNRNSSTMIQRRQRKGGQRRTGNFLRYRQGVRGNIPKKERKAGRHTHTLETHSVFALDRAQHLTPQPNLPNEPHTHDRPSKR